LEIAKKINSVGVLTCDVGRAQMSHSLQIVHWRWH